MLHGTLSHTYGKGTVYFLLIFVVYVLLWSNGTDGDMYTQDDWNTKYGAAMLELDPAKLQTCIHSARLAIEQRVNELRSGGVIHGQSSELQALSDALRSLRTLERVEGVGTVYTDVSPTLGQAS